MTGNRVAGHMHRIHRTSDDSLLAEICRGNAQRRQQGQTYGISGGSDTAKQLAHGARQHVS